MKGSSSEENPVITEYAVITQKIIPGNATITDKAPSPPPRLALKKALEENLRNTRIENFLVREIRRLYDIKPDTKIICKDLRKEDGAGISDIHKVFSFEKEGKKIVLHAKTTASTWRLQGTPLTEGFLYKALEQLGIGPKSHSTIMPGENLGMTNGITFTITEDVALQKQNSAKNPTASKEYTFKTPNQIKEKNFRKLTIEEIKLLTGPNKAPNNSAFACINFVGKQHKVFDDRDSLIEELKKINHYTDDIKTLKHCAFADAIKYILSLGDLTYNTGNSGALSKITGGSLARFNPIFIDFDTWQDPKYTPQTSMPILFKVDTMLGGKTILDIRSQFLPGITYQTGEHSLKIAKEVLKELQEGTQKEGVNKTPPLSTAIKNAKQYILKLTDDKDLPVGVNGYIDFVTKRLDAFTKALSEKIEEKEKELPTNPPVPTRRRAVVATATATETENKKLPAIQETAEERPSPNPQRVGCTSFLSNLFGKGR